MTNDMEQINRSAERLIRLYKSYAGDTADTGLLESAIAFGKKAHEGQKRATGEPFFIHPMAVAEILTELEVDQYTLCAAILHDTVEDTGRTKAEIEAAFGKGVAELVDGVTKLEKVSFHSKEELQAENFRKMFLAMAKDIRVVIIKLADRLHNMRTMKHLPPEKQKQKARETLDIYAPLAHRLGIYVWKWELEDLCFRYLNTTAYYDLVSGISLRRSDREAYLEEVVSLISAGLEKIGITAEVEGRPKHFYSIYRKMIEKHKTLEEIYDLFACRIIVETVADCYAALGMVHEMFHPMPGRFKDYIATPKQNMYQSLHTTVIGPRGRPFEVQIRTFEMHAVAEFGIAAHYRYKEGGKNNHTNDEQMNQKLSWLRQLLDWQKDVKDADEYMDTLRTGLIEDEVYVFTPQGDVVALPQGAVPIDFAYNIHSGVGNAMTGAKVNGRLVPHTYELQNGDIVEILTGDQSRGPSLDWLKLAKSNSAKAKIRHWFKQQSRDEDIVRGREQVEKEISKIGFKASKLLKPEFMEPLQRRYSYNKADDIFANVGHGTLSVKKIVPRLRDAYIRSLSPAERAELGYHISPRGQVIYAPLPTVTEKEKGKEKDKGTGKGKQSASKTGNSDFGIVVKGIDHCLVRLSRCCNPVPGDAIVGYVTRGKGVAVHRRSCPNIRKLLSGEALSAQDAERVARLIEVAWDEEDLGQNYEVALKILAKDRMTLLSDVSNAVATEGVPIISMELSTLRGVTTVINLRIDVTDQEQYERVAGRIRSIKEVTEVIRGS